MKCEIIHETLQRYCKLFLLQDTHILRAHAVIKLEVKLQRPPGKLKHHRLNSSCCSVVANSYGLCVSHTFVGVDDINIEHWSLCSFGYILIMPATDCIVLQPAI